MPLHKANRAAAPGMWMGVPLMAANRVKGTSPSECSAVPHARIVWTSVAKAAETSHVAYKS
jgi:hypothetical protein